MVADFADSQKEGFYEKIYSQIETLDISMLVNNVGISNIGEFKSLSIERIK